MTNPRHQKREAKKLKKKIAHQWGQIEKEFHPVVVKRPRRGASSPSARAKGHRIDALGSSGVFL